MNCPDCSDRLTEKEHEGVLVDECVRCSGMWFDPGELNRYRKAASRNPGRPEDPDGETFAVYNAQPVSVCPRCESRTMQAGVIGKLDLSRCMSCHGVYLSGSWWKSFRTLSTEKNRKITDPGPLIEALIWIVAIIGSD
jgi:Zn-finger nucleic acid-binding protein